MMFLPHKKNIYELFEIFTVFCLDSRNRKFYTDDCFMKQKGHSTYIGVSLKDLMTYFKEDAVIHVSKKFMESYKMISGITEAAKPVSIKITDKSEIIEEPKVIEKIDTSIKEEIAPAPIEVNVSDGDW